MAATWHLPPARLNDGLVPLCQKSRRVANESLRDKASRLTPTLSAEATAGICRVVRTEHSFQRATPRPTDYESRRPAYAYVPFDLRKRLFAVLPLISHPTTYSLRVTFTVTIHHHAATGQDRAQGACRKCSLPESRRNWPSAFAMSRSAVAACQHVRPRRGRRACLHRADTLLHCPVARR
jgi:hypothetical protein